MKTVKLLEVNVPSKKGYLFSREVTEQIAQTEQALGTFYDPSSVELTIDLSKVSHIAKNLRLENDVLLADIEPLGTPMGNILKELLTANTKLEFYPRGTGLLAEDGAISDYKLISIDVRHETRA